MSVFLLYSIILYNTVVLESDRSPSQSISTLECSDFFGSVLALSKERRQLSYVSGKARFLNFLLAPSNSSVHKLAGIRDIFLITPAYESLVFQISHLYHQIINVCTQFLLQIVVCGCCER